jgi:hypothetical protein
MDDAPGMMNARAAEFSVKPELLRLIPPDARIIVQVGCRSDALAAAYRCINSEVRFFGLTNSSEPPSTAANCGAFDALISTDFDTIQPSHLGLDQANPEVDCLIFDEISSTPCVAGPIR